MASPNSGRRGVTLIEMMVVIAIVGVVSALAATSLGAMQPRMNINSATQSFLAMAGEAQARALSSQQDTWLIVYTQATGGPAVAGGFFLYEASPDFDFNALSVLGAHGAAALDDDERVNQEVWFDEGEGEPRVQIDMAGDVFPLVPPFAGSSSGCNFCSVKDGEGVRGAIVFQSDGQVRFVNGEGAPVNTDVAVLTLRGGPDLPDSRMAIGLSTAGFTRVTKP